MMEQEEIYPVQRGDNSGGIPGPGNTGDDSGPQQLGYSQVSQNQGPAHDENPPEPAGMKDFQDPPDLPYPAFEGAMELSKDQVMSALILT